MLTINRIITFTDEHMKSIRDKYFANEIFKYGEIVEDITTGEKMKILDRGSNYVTVATSKEVIKKWLNEIREETIVEDVVEVQPKTQDFIIQEDGQIKLFGHVTNNFNSELSEFILEQFAEFDDLYSKHQIIKCLDYAIGDTDIERAYDLLEKVDAFYSKKSMQSPIIVEGLKTDIERKRLAEIIAAVADIRPSKTVQQTVSMSIKELRKKYTQRKQWEVIWPLFKLAMNAGMDGIMQNLPYTFESPNSARETNEELEDIVFCSTLEDNLDTLVEDMEWEDYESTFEEAELCEEFLSETLSITGRSKLAHKMSQHADYLSVRRGRALQRAATSDVLMSRARRLAEIMLKRRMFHKDPGTLNRQEKERFEAGASGRRVLIAKLAQRLIGKVRALQSTRAHHTHTQVSDKNPETVVRQAKAVLSTGIGAS